MSGTAHLDRTPAQLWHGLLRPEVEFAPEFSAELNARMRAEKLTFGDRVHCPFLRPFFLTSNDENRVREVAELIAQLGERVVQQALGTLDNRLVATIGLRHTFMPEWKWFSPTAGLGTGYQHIVDKVPPAPLESTNQLAYVSLGARGFITRRFMWRADWRHYVVFNSLNVYEDLEEWKFGFAVFF